MPRACYRKLSKYKYQLMKEYVMQIGIRPQRDINRQFFSLSLGGLLTIKQGYAWDGASGPAIDTTNIMRGSLVHDALYQLMRLGDLDYRVHRQPADELLRSMCLEDGMSSFWAWGVYQAVHRFGESRARPTAEPEVEVICVP